MIESDTASQPGTAALLRGQLGCWFEGGCRITPISVSENELFQIEADDGRRFVLRLHRPGYQSRDGIESELAWLSALGRDTGLALARPVPGRDGELLQTLRVGDSRRHAVLFHHETGREPSPDGDLTGLFGRLGHFAATMHRHVETWRRPAGFVRPVLSEETLLDPAGAWGDWRRAPGLSGPAASIIARAEPVLRRALAEYGRDADRFGLIHADMRLGNLLVDGDRVCLIDFDDCGIGWFGYDFAAAASFYECHPALPAWRAAWLEAYRRVRPFSAHDEAMLGAMVLLRRLALLAWIGSHAETELARSHSAGYAEGTAALAEAFVRERVR